VFSPKLRRAINLMKKANIALLKLVVLTCGILGLASVLPKAQAADAPKPSEPLKVYIFSTDDETTADQNFVIVQIYKRVFKANPNIQVVDDKSNGRDVGVAIVSTKYYIVSSWMTLILRINEKQELIFVDGFLSSCSSGELINKAKEAAEATNAKFFSDF
jgi:hypothetical protein